MAEEPDINGKAAGGGYAYLVRAEDGLYKIGASWNPLARLRSLPKTHGALSLAHAIRTHDPYGLEECLHATFAAKRVAGEWFRLDENDVALVQSLSDVCLDNLPAWVIAPPARTKPRQEGRKTFSMTPNSLSDVRAIQLHYGLSSETAAVRLALRAAARAIRQTPA